MLKANTAAPFLFSQENELDRFGERLRQRQALPPDLRRASVPGRDDRHFEIDQRHNLRARRPLPGRDIRRIAPVAAKTVKGGLCCEFRQPNEFRHSSALQLSQSHRFDAMRLAFA